MDDDYLDEDQDDILGEQAKKHLTLAYKLQMSGSIESAIKEYKRSIEIQPSEQAWAFLGWAHSFLGDYEEAIICCEEAIKINPNYPNAWNDLGAYQIQLGLLDDAIPNLERAIEIKLENYSTPHFPHYNLGRIFERRGLWFEALDEYKEALKLEPKYEPAKTSRMRLQALLN